MTANGRDPRARYLLVTDVDDTVLGDDEALERWVAWLDDHPDLLAVAYSSGRFVESVLGSVAVSALPPPVAVVGGVGTEMRTWPGGQFVTAWRERLAQGWDARAIHARLTAEPDLVPQPPSAQGPFKLSYELPEATITRLESLRAAVSGLGGHLVYSSNRDLDVLPQGADKGSAARFLAEHLGFDAEHVFVAGNSGNDRALFEQGFRGIVVGNAHPELKQMEGPRTYVARAGWADGVVEGLERWLVEDGALALSRGP